MQLDRARHHRDAGERVKADALVALLTPVVKAALTDFGFESAVEAQQVFGGHGYIREWGMEQYVRDGRIAQIYEGTNGVQAMDLVARKLPLSGGSVVGGFLDIIAADLETAGTVRGAALVTEKTRQALTLLRDATASLQGADMTEAGAAAVDYLRLFALVAFGWMWARMAAADGESPLHRSKRQVADYYALRVLPQAQALAAQVAVGAAPMMALESALF